MRYTPSLQNAPLNHWLQITLISLLAGLSLLLFGASAYHLIHTFSSPPPAEPAAALAAVRSTPAPHLTQITKPTKTALPASPDAAKTPAPEDASVDASLPTETPLPAPTPIPGQAIILQPSGLTVMFIPGGTFKMGGNGNEMRRHTVTIDSFWMSRTQVTNARYAQCVEAGGCTHPIRKAINPHYYNPAFAKHPAVYITWDQAEAYCVWAGGHLPTEAQWERATGPREYAWGSADPDHTRANINNSKGSTRPVGSFPKGATKYGVLDMGGNVREWVYDWYSSRLPSGTLVNPTGPEKGIKKVLRGAAWYDPWKFARTGNRLAHVPGSSGANRGFRCAFPEPFSVASSTDISLIK